LPAYMSAPAAMAEDAMEIHPGTPNIYFTQKIAKGEDTGPYSTPPMWWWKTISTWAASPTCPWSRTWGSPIRMTKASSVIHSKSIGIHLHMLMIAPGLGVEPENMVMVQNPAGGTFGYKFSPTMEALVGAACLATGRPVFWSMTTISR
jgi:aldehyde oxidoreductase